jgi:hypothetical protein
VPVVSAAIPPSGGVHLLLGVQAGLDSLGEGDLLHRGQQTGPADAVQVCADEVGRHAALVGGVQVGQRLDTVRHAVLDTHLKDHLRVPFPANIPVVLPATVVPVINSLAGSALSGGEAAVRVA